jgi:Zn-finger domain-containing protein
MNFKPKQEIMKRVILFAVALALPALMIAQNSAVDNLFNKYKGQEGVTTVQISPELFQIINAMDIDELDNSEIPFDKVASVKILTIEDEEKNQGVNFYDEIKGQLKTDDFAEIMTVDDGGETVRMWMKADKAVVSEFLLIVGGDDNVLIYITGNFNMKDLEELAGSFDHDLDIDLDL